MIHAYDRVYLEKARTALGRMLDFAVYDMKYDLKEFYDLFLHYGIAKRFEMGDFTLLVGKSGVELAYEVLDSSNMAYERVPSNYTMNRSEEYWAGWALAYYQWKTGLSFSEIDQAVSIEKVRDMYSPYHEMDIRQFCDRMNELYRIANPNTKLKERRQRAGMSQRELAEESDVPLRTIQQYEQRQKNINKGQGETLLKLAKALGCKMEDLIENI